MRCFVHADRDAVGICRSCYKGLCSDCAVDLQHSLACRGAHEEEAERLHSMVSRAQRVQTTSSSARYLAPAFMVVLGVVCAGYGYAIEGVRGPLFPLGVIFLVYGVSIFLVRRRAWGTRQADG